MGLVAIDHPSRRQRSKSCQIIAFGMGAPPFATVGRKLKLRRHPYQFRQALGTRSGPSSRG